LELQLRPDSYVEVNVAHNRPGSRGCIGEQRKIEVGTIAALKTEASAAQDERVGGGTITW